MAGTPRSPLTAAAATAEEATSPQPHKVSAAAAAYKGCHSAGTLHTGRGLPDRPQHWRGNTGQGKDSGVRPPLLLVPMTSVTGPATDMHVCYSSASSLSPLRYAADAPQAARTELSRQLSPCSPAAGCAILKDRGPGGCVRLPAASPGSKGPPGHGHLPPVQAPARAAQAHWGAAPPWLRASSIDATVAPGATCASLRSALCIHKHPKQDKHTCQRRQHADGPLGAGTGGH